MIIVIHNYFKLNQEPAAYEIPREEVFDAAGLYVPTAVSHVVRNLIDLLGVFP